ncbi:MAG: TIGR02266 family protein [Myxococcales bacterium]|nr:TIGR02266 family protein [Myxococcales bacterium]
MDDRRTSERFPACFPVDVRSGDHFLYAHVANISEMGLFVRTDEPLAIGTIVRLVLCPSGVNGASAPFEADGTVTWVNEVRPDGENLNPGMGVRFDGLTPEVRERLVELVRTIAYLND